MVQDARNTEEQSTLRRARILGLSYIDTSQISNKLLYKQLLNKDELYMLKVIPIEADESHITFGIVNTTSPSTLPKLRQKFNDQRVSFALISDAGYREYLRLYDPPKKVEYHDINIATAGSEDLITNVSRVLEQVKADDMLAYLVHQAHKLKASDIHTENELHYVRIRFRIDGVLHPIARLSHEKYRILVAAVASAANISTQSPDTQQGHIAQRVIMADKSEVDVNLRVETVPTIYGMDIVMRLFNLSPEMYSLDRLGLSEEERKVVDDIIAKPSGLVMAVGPTGSGKTTTLYSILNSLNTDSRKIITIEDPVEYQFEGMTQISITTKGTQDIGFAEKLRAVLRLDPDIVMVGEVRDMDTAKTALQAALTGHLVLSTFHAGSASAALTRLMDVVGANPLFGSAIRLVMAQRLVRKLDDTIKQAYDPTPQEIDYITKSLANLPDRYNKPDLAQIKLYKPGKSDTNPYGFDGQLAIREQFVMSSQILQAMQSKDLTTTSEQIEAIAVKNGMKTMRHDAVLKVCAGQTTLAEVIRVLG